MKGCEISLTRTKLDSAGLHIASLKQSTIHEGHTMQCYHPYTIIIHMQNNNI